MAQDPRVLTPNSMFTAYGRSVPSSLSMPPAQMGGMAAAAPMMAPPMMAPPMPMIDPATGLPIPGAADWGAGRTVPYASPPYVSMPDMAGQHMMPDGAMMGGPPMPVASPMGGAPAMGGQPQMGAQAAPYDVPRPFSRPKYGGIFDDYFRVQSQGTSQFARTPEEQAAAQMQRQQFLQANRPMTPQPQYQQANPAQPQRGGMNPMDRFRNRSVGAMSRFGMGRRPVGR